MPWNSPDSRRVQASGDRRRVNSEGGVYISPENEFERYR